MVNSNQDNIDLINEFINKVFTRNDDYDLCLRYMGKLNYFLRNNEYELKVDSIVILLNNNESFRKCVERIFVKNRKQIVEGKEDYIFKNPILINIIDVYCMVNNINIEEDDNIEYFSRNVQDSINIYYQDIKGYDLLSYEEEQELTRRIKNGDEEAKDKFIKHNLRLVIKIARRYQNSGLALSDLIQEGNLGLMTAVEKFDPDLGFRFSTYAYNWIKQGITRAIANSGNAIRLPVYLIEKHNRLVKTINLLSKELNREPTKKELADALGIPEEKIDDLYSIQTNIASLDTLIGEDEDTELSSFIPDPNVNVEEEVVLKTVREDIAKLFEKANLSDRERTVIIFRFGLDGSKPKTLEDIGSIYGLTRERIRQIEERSIAKLRRYKYLIDDKSGISIIRGNSRPYTCDDELSGLRKANTIYRVFSTYSKKEIERAIALLSDEERELLFKRYGNDLTVEHRSTLNPAEKSIYYNRVLGKLRGLLRNNRTIPNKSKDEEESSPVAKTRKRNSISLGNDAEEKMSNYFSSSIKAKQENIARQNEMMYQNIVFTSKEMTCLSRVRSTIQKEDYERLLEILLKIKQKEELKEIRIQELIILLLSLGYVNHRYYGSNEISRILNIDIETVGILSKKVLYEYRNILVDLDNITSKKYVLK